MAMGLTHVTVRIAPVSGSRKSFSGEFLVDTGAVDCLAPASALRRIGVKPEGNDSYEMANGDIVEYPYAYARIEFMGSSTIARVVFGPDHVEPILGVVALENTGIGIDPVTKTLRRMAARPLKAVHAR